MCFDHDVMVSNISFSLRILVKKLESCILLSICIFCTLHKKGKDPPTGECNARKPFYLSIYLSIHIQSIYIYLSILYKIKNNL